MEPTRRRMQLCFRSCLRVFIDHFISWLNFAGMRFPWEYHDQSKETNLTSLRHRTATVLLSQKKSYTKDAVIGFVWVLHALMRRLPIKLKRNNKSRLKVFSFRPSQFYKEQNALLVTNTRNKRMTVESHLHDVWHASTYIFRNEL